jgi:hypothetical protein
MSHVDLVEKTCTMRVPTLNVHCGLCGAATVLTIRVDNRMTSENLKETVLQQYHTYCRDEGVPFQPPSLNPQDYSVYPSNEQGVASGAAPLRNGKHSGETLRDQLVAMTPPYFAVISIGQSFLERDAVIQDESLERDVMIEKRNKLMQSVTFMEQVSCEKAIELQLFRERQENTVSRVEDVMLYAYVAYTKYHAKIDAESSRLVEMDAVWRDQCVPWIRTAMDAVQQDKRTFLAASKIAVKSLAESLSIP